MRIASPLINCCKPSAVKQHNVLISSGGRRVGLAACFRRSLADRGGGGWVGTIESGSTAPLPFLVDRAWRVPKCTEPEFIDAVLGICVQHSIDLIVPTTDRELDVYARNREFFAGFGITAAISDVQTITIACDKARTHSWLTANGFHTVRQACLCEVLRSPGNWEFPLIAKPRTGSGSIGVQIINSPEDLGVLARTQTPYLIQEIAQGREFTINAYVGSSGTCIAAVPHWRMEVRAGEVSKGLTVKDFELMETGRRIVESLPGAYGALNIQCFANGAEPIRVIEINARFGGGYPLTHQAGARFTDWLLDELDGRPLSRFEDWTNDLAMLRYDAAIFVDGSRIRE
jgi:carbamoyl-phosphate synthase large subunit